MHNMHRMGTFIRANEQKMGGGGGLTRGSYTVDGGEFARPRAVLLRLGYSNRSVRVCGTVQTFFFSFV